MVTFNPDGTIDISINSGDGQSTGLDSEDGSTSFWEISGLVLSAIQMIYYLMMFDEYADKLEWYAGKLHGWAEQDKEVYKRFREMDQDYYDYYLGLPDYEVCDSAVSRGKGNSFYNYGTTLRATLDTVRGYTPMARVHINNMVAERQHVTSHTAINRVGTLIDERARKHDYMLDRWSAVIGAPVGVEGFNAGVTAQVVRESFKSLENFGQGFNSAGSAFGTQLYKILT